MKVLVLDESDYWEFLKQDFLDQGIYLTIANHSEAWGKLQSDFVWDLVIAHEGGSSGGSLINVLESQEFDVDRAYPTVVVNNFEQNLSNEKARWRNLGNILEINSVLPLPIAPRKLAELSKPTNPKWLSQVENVPIPSRLLDENRQVLATNSLWNWDRYMPAPELGGQINAEFPMPSNKRMEGYSILHEAIQSNGKILQVATEQKQYYTGSLQDPDAMELDRIIVFIWDLMREIGFTQMRYFEVRRTPESTGVLSLEKIFGRDQLTKKNLVDKATDAKAPVWFGNETGTFSVPIDTAIHGNFEKIRQNANETKTEVDLISEIVCTGKRRSMNSPSIEFIYDLFEFKDNRQILYIPVFMQPSLTIRALITVDIGGGFIRNDVLDVFKRRSHSILHLIRQLKSVMIVQREREASRDQAALSNFLRGLMPSTIDENSRDAFITAICRKCLELTGFSFAAVAWRRHKGVEPRVTTVQLKKGSYNSNGVKNRRSLKDKKVTPEQLPALHLAFKREKPVYFHEGISQEFEQDLNDHLPRFALPISVVGEVRGAIGLSVTEPQFRFLQRDVQKIEMLLSMCAPIIFYMDQAIAATQWEFTILHEVRSTLGSARRYVSKLDPSPDQEVALWFLQDLIDSTTKLRLDGKADDGFDPSPSLDTELSRAKTIAKLNFKKIFALRLEALNKKISGKKAAFEFSIRTLLSNALRHGDRPKPGIYGEIKVRSYFNGNKFCLSVENLASDLTQEEVDIVFVRNAIRVGIRSTDGSHTAMSDSKQLVELFDGSLDFQRIERENKVYALAVLSWPCRDEDLNK